MTTQINYQEIIKQGIQLINDWKIKQQNKDSENFKELERVINEIQNDQDFSKDSYEDIRYVLRPFENSLSLNIKKLFNISTMNQYSMFIASRYFDSIDDHINLILATTKFNENLSKFYYNPFPLTETTRTFFPYLQTLYIYSEFDNLFDLDPYIMKREIRKVNKYDLYHYQVEHLEQWTGLKCGEILFDSNIHKMDELSSEFDNKIFGKSKLLFLIEDQEGEKFGYYFNSVIDKYHKRIETDQNTFEFNIQSKNYRLKEPMKFEIKDLRRGGMILYEKSHEELIHLGDIVLKKHDLYDLESFCFDNIDIFNYKGEEKSILRELNPYIFTVSLCGKTYPYYFIRKRILVIQMV